MYLQNVKRYPSTVPSLFNSLPLEPRRVASGVAYLPGFLPLEEQQRLVELARASSRGMARPWTHSGQMSVYMQALGVGLTGDFTRYGVAKLPMPEWASDLGRRALRAATEVAPELPTEFRPEMMLINYYPPGATMGMHQDAAEESQAPIVSLSIGDSAVFRLGNTQNRNRPWRDIQLHSGDLLVFGEEHRLAYHGVPKVLGGTLPEGCGLAQGRLNLTIRQVTSP